MTQLQTLYCKWSRHWISVQRITYATIFCFNQVHVHEHNTVTCDCEPTQWFPDQDSAIEYALFHSTMCHDYGDWCSSQNENTS